MDNEYEIEEIVWGKVNGYPWWPGFVKEKIDDNLYEVVFLSDFSRAFLPN